ncbi:MAG: hypothetical protein CVU06_01325 [Bacteroidetes bacterium HGW-Bacteroidetes-22]|nr:MAG: hypothetical protein CVU06_01325 [Bacteroidetes bacterium HGW-Bacteroidetes-22]
MLKKIIMISCVAVFAISCNQNAPKEESQTVLTIAQLIEQAPDLVGKEITVTGTVDHVCKHGGKRMFLVGNNDQERMKVNLGEGQLSFNPEMEGNDLVVKGVVDELKIDKAYLDQWESEVMADTQGEAASKVHMGEVGHENNEGNKNEDLEKIAEYRKQIEASGTDHVSFYSVNCISFEDKKQ